MLFCPIASGSSGNCTYIATKETHILIDAGVSGKRINAALSGFAVPKLSAIFVTHEHTDHITGVGVMARRYNVPVYATPKTWQYMLNNGSVGDIPQHLQHTITPDQPIIITDMTVTAFNIPHDAVQPVGYFVTENFPESPESPKNPENSQKQPKTAAVATDIGYITDTIRHILRKAEILLIESNHDVEMLKNGNYPPHLKKRILGTNGHLSNVAAGVLLVEIASPHLRHVYLGHLSSENNRPYIALNTIENILAVNNIKINGLTIANRNEKSPAIEW
ncbi:MAG: MBL fold metallo-hydrolase [Defluviitaleaceae bacterium]|nr:MBL fold metallo-hydrolase [Defluviitaleaceae bacterium]